MQCSAPSLRKCSHDSWLPSGPAFAGGGSAAVGIDRVQCGQLGAAERVERGSQHARELPGAKGAEHRHLGGLESLRHPLGLVDERLPDRARAALAHPPAVDLDRDEDLVLLADA